MKNAIRIGLATALLGSTLLAGCAGPSSSGFVPTQAQSVKRAHGNGSQIGSSGADFAGIGSSGADAAVIGSAGAGDI
jgi:hypothetical protein